MYNIKDLLEQKKKLGIFLAFSLIGLATIGISLIPAMNYMTGQNMANQPQFFLPQGFIILFAIFATGVFVSIILLSLISKKLYIVKSIDDSIKGIKKGKSFVPEKVLPRRDELLQSHFAEKIKESGLPSGKLKIFDGMSQAEHDEIVGFKIDSTDLGKKQKLEKL
ncbi:MAG TPA: hypothetical protein VKM55_03230 [Candidatus Lokiarchaeia archaeon]|nr:hypothetical protein [Candidatus Lokiarchaeia archaeon]